MKTSVGALQTQISQQLYQSSETASLDAQILIAHILERPRSWILAHPEAPVNETQYHNLIRAVDRLINGEPLPYVIGHWEFYGLNFLLTPAVLIPRPETELLVDQAIKWLQLNPTRRRAIDIGTGSGCIGIAMANSIPDLHVVLTDISCEALDVAQLNGKNFGLTDRLEFIQADLLAWITGPFDLLCANLPYIPTSRLMSLSVAKKEPPLALDGGQDGTDLICKLLEQAKDRLVTGGLLLLEIDASQGNDLLALAGTLYPASKVQIIKDPSGQDRCLVIEQSSLIVHICQRKEWLDALQEGKFIDASLNQGGFVHCSRPENILDLANHYYQQIPDLVILWINPDRLISDIRWESSDQAIFPHIHGPINLDAINSITNLEPDSDGSYRNIQLPI